MFTYPQPGIHDEKEKSQSLVSQVVSANAISKHFSFRLTWRSCWFSELNSREEERRRALSRRISRSENSRTRGIWNTIVFMYGNFSRGTWVRQLVISVGYNYIYFSAKEPLSQLIARSITLIYQRPSFPPVFLLLFLQRCCFWFFPLQSRLHLRPAIDQSLAFSSASRRVVGASMVTDRRPRNVTLRISQ